MKKIFFVIASIYLGVYLIIILPTFTAREGSFIQIHNASEREAMIIKNVCEKKDRSIRHALVSMLGIYALYCGSMFLGRKKPNQPLERDGSHGGASR